MGYISKKGVDAVESAQHEKQDFSKFIKSLKSGTAFKVRVPSANDVVEVYMHSVYDVFYSTPCTTRDDLYDKAVELLRADQKQEDANGNTALAEQLGKHAYNLTAKPRYLFGFINLENGEPIIIDLSKKQAQGIITTIKKYEKRLNQLAFEISKTGSGQSTAVTINPLMFLDEDLTEKELANFKATEGKQVPDEVYENCLYVKQVRENAQDLIDYEAYAKKGNKTLPSIDLALTTRLDLNSYISAPAEPEVEAEPIDEGTEGEYDF